MNQVLKITYPLDGEILNTKLALQDSNVGYKIKIQGTALSGQKVSLDGQTGFADENGNFTFWYPVKKAKNIFTVSSGNENVTQSFLFDFDERKRCNFFIDDNIFFLKELHIKKHVSIFDCFYLNFLRNLHEKYDFKVTLNTFMNNDHDTGKNPFSTRMLSDRYKSEFEDNSDWLRLAFHALSEFPGAPYREAFPEKLTEHYKAVTTEIKRYAGERTLIPPVLLHFYDACHAESRHYVRNQGMRIYARSDKYWSAINEQCGRKILGNYCEEFQQIQIPVLFICNCFPTDILLKKLNEAYSHPEQNFLLIGSHEQYSFPFYSNYIPEHFHRIESVVRSLKEHGFESIFFTDDFLPELK